MPFLALFLCGFGYVGWVSLWQGGVGVATRAFGAHVLARVIAPRRRVPAIPIVPPPGFPVLGSQVLGSQLGELGDGVVHAELRGRPTAATAATRVLS
jgi:hypothetical protein